MNRRLFICMLWIESDNKRQIAPGSSRVSARLLPTQMSKVNIKELERWLCSKTSYTKKRHLGRGWGWDFKDGGTQSHQNGTHLDFNQEKLFRLNELMISDYFENFCLVQDLCHHEILAWRGGGIITIRFFETGSAYFSNTRRRVSFPAFLFSFYCIK